MYRMLAALAMSLFAFLGVFAMAGPAHAEADPVDEESAYSISGILNFEGEPVEGVALTVEGDGYSETVESGDDGRWRVPVPGPGNYTVTLDTETLPDGVDLRNEDGATAEVTEDEWSTTNVGRLFALGEDTRQSSNFGSQLIERLVAGLNFGLLIALGAIGITLIFGTTGLNNFSHGELVTFGGLMAWLFAVVMGLNIFVAMIIVVILGAAFGWVQDATLWKPLRKRGVRLVPAMIVSIGLGLALRYLYQFFFGGAILPMSSVGLSGAVEFGPVRITTGSLLSMGISIVTLVLVGLFLTRTRVGKATRAVSDNPSLASASGINVDRIIRIVWTTAGGLAALAGVMLALYRQTSWDMGFQVLLLMFAAVTLGGLGSAYGALVGSLVVGIFVELSTLFIPADLKYAAALLILILVLLVRPQGILGRRERVG